MSNSNLRLLKRLPAVIVILAVIALLVFVFAPSSHKSAPGECAGDACIAPVGAVYAGSDGATAQAAAQAAAEARAAAATAAATPAASAASTAGAPAAEASIGEQTYKKTCSVCHGTTALGAPMMGHKDEWAPRIAQGKDTLYKHALEGFTGEKGAMPAHGGNPALDDDTVRAAVDYMVGNSQ